jgi:hypothetical protein
MLRKKRIVVAFTIFIIAVFAVAAYATLFNRVSTSGYSVRAMSDQLNMGIDGIYCWDCSTNDTYPAGHTTPATALAAGQTYTFALGVWNTMDCPTGPTYMKYTLTANEDFRLSYLQNYTECNCDWGYKNSTHEWGYGTSDCWFGYTAAAIKWYEEDVGGKWQVTMWVPSDPFTIPANHWFITEAWFKLADDTPNLSGFTWTMEEHNAIWTHEEGTVLHDCCNMPLDADAYWDNTWPSWPVHAP